MACGDVLSLEDLQTAKKHQIFEAEVITGKAGGVAGGVAIDYATNQVTGQTQKTLPAVLRDAGFRPASFTFATGGTLAVGDSDVVVLWPVSSGGDGQYYLWKGVYPKIIPASSTPATTGGVSDAGWLPWGDITLRDEIANPGGSSLMGFQQAGAGSVARTAQDKMRERVTPQDKGAVGDGVTNDQSAFTALESMPTGTEVDLLGKTYLVDALPVNHRYINGYIKHSVDGYVYDANQQFMMNVGNRNVLLAGAGASMPKWVKYKQSGTPYNVFAIGWEALAKNVFGRNLTALGSGALHELINGRYNIAIGLESQYYCNSDDGAVITGTRNTSIGDNSLRFNVTGYSNCAMGRNTGQNIVSVDFNTAIGAAAMSGYSPLAIDGVTIENQSPITAGEQTHIGTNAGFWSNSLGNTSVGCYAAGNIKTGQIVAIGHQAGMNIEVDRHYNGKQKLFVSLSGTYSWSGGTITCTVTGHGLLTGFVIKTSIGGREANYLPVTVADANTFTITTPYLNTDSGAITISEVVTTTSLTPITGVIAIGRRAMASANNCQNSVAIGETSQFASTGTNNVSLGGLTLNGNTTGSMNLAAGYSALRFNTTGGQNTAVGEFAVSNNTTGSRITAVGRNALRNNQAGASMDGFDNVSGLGADSRVSGSNQVQLGDPSTTTYVYGTVQNRSDERDKADIQDTQLGIDFIMGLRPVDGRWDMRDDYLVQNDDGTITQLEKDGSKKRQRLHHWFIAQEVKELCDSLGVEFGGYQDHSVNGGCDVLSLGYDEFIPPTVKAVQQCWTRLDELEKRIAKLEH